MNNRDEIRLFLETLFEPGDVFEIRAPNTAQRPGSTYTATASGYFTFDAISEAVDAITNLDDSEQAPSIYVTLNPVEPSLVARALNRILPKAKATTADSDVVRRRWIIIDVDPARPAGVSSTESELEQARDFADRIRESLPWCPPVVAESGNGVHLLYRVDLPTEDGEIVKRALNAIADTFDDSTCKVDRTMFNPARITKIIGTVARKGDDVSGVAGVEDRPHRRARFVEIPDEIEITPAEEIERVAGETKSDPPARVASSGYCVASLDGTVSGVRAWLEERGVTIKGEKPGSGGGTLLFLERCPVTDTQSTGSSDIAVSIAPDGMLAYHNHHNRGAGIEWTDVRAALDPMPVEIPGVDISAIIDGNGSPAIELKPIRVGPSPSFRSVADLVTAYPRLKPPVIEGLLREGETMNIIAPPKMGKSWMVLDLAIAVATGRPWLGRFGTVPGDVLILDAELHSETSAARIPKVATARRAPAHYAERVHIENFRGRLTDIHQLASYFQSIEPGRFRMIVVDALYRFLPAGASENDNAALARVYNAIDRYAEELQCAFVLIHHASKGNQSGKGVTDVGAGAGAQSRATDTHLVLREHEEKGAVVLDAAVRSWKPIDPVCLRFDFPVWESAANLNPTALRAIRPIRAPKVKIGMEEFVSEFVPGEPTPTAKIILAADEIGLSSRRTRDFLTSAEADGLVTRTRQSGANKAHLWARVLPN